MVGTSCSMQVPSPRGPRQPAQNSALDVFAELASRMAKTRIRFMTSRISFGANAPQIANTIEVRTECSMCLIPYGTQIHRNYVLYHLRSWCLSLWRLKLRDFSPDQGWGRAEGPQARCACAALPGNQVGDEVSAWPATADQGLLRGAEVAQRVTAGCGPERPCRRRTCLC